MSMCNDIAWRDKVNFRKVREFPRGHLSVLEPGSEMKSQGTYTDNSGHPTVLAFEEENYKAKEGGNKHFNRSVENRVASPRGGFCESAQCLRSKSSSKRGITQRSLGSKETCSALIVENDGNSDSPFVLLIQKDNRCNTFCWNTRFFEMKKELVSEGGFSKIREFVQF